MATELGPHSRLKMVMHEMKGKDSTSNYTKYRQRHETYDVMFLEEIITYMKDGAIVGASVGD